jgi:DNA replication protein DnaC
MLINPILDKLRALGLEGMLKALEEQLNTPDAQDLAFEERLGLMVDRETTHRENRRLKTRLAKARLRHDACLEDIDYRQKRGMDKSLIMALASCRWIAEHHNLLISGPTGVGKSFVACALGHKACLEGCSVSYKRVPALLRELVAARGDGSYQKMIAAGSKTNLLILDDWGLEKLSREQSLDMLEVLEDRYGRGSTIVTAQVPVDQWHETISDPTLADAILDRLVHNAYKINLKGESMRKKLAGLTGDKNPVA